MNTALHLTAMWENKELCELLIDKGARVNKKNKIGFTPLDSALYSSEMPGFEGESPEPTEAHTATVAYLRSKGAKSMTPEERAEADPFGGMMDPNDPFGGMPMPGMGFPGGGMPGGLGPNPYMLPNGGPYGGGFNPLYGTPKGKKPAKSKRQ